MTNLDDQIRKKIKEQFWDHYATQGSTLSNICRQLAFAEGGICWFYISGQDLHADVIKFILKVLITFFIFDIFQYLYSVSIYYVVAKCYERNLKLYKDDTDIKKPPWINIPAVIFFIFKIVALFLASYKLMSDILNV